MAGLCGHTHSTSSAGVVGRTLEPGERWKLAIGYVDNLTFKEPAMPMERYTSTTSIPYYVYTHSFKELAVPGYMHSYACVAIGPVGAVCRAQEVRTGTRERLGTMWSIKRSTTGAHL